MDSEARRTQGVLVVDDDRDLLDVLAQLVEQSGFIPLTAAEPAGALELFEKEQPVVAVVDLNLQPWDGYELVAELRRRSPTLSIIVLTARSSEEDKVRALEIGADDYVVKPFGRRELIARIRAQARRGQSNGEPATPTILQVGPLSLDSMERTLRLDGKMLRLTSTEFRLLQSLMQNGDSVVPTGALAKDVFGYDDLAARESLRVAVHRLRRKLGDLGPERRFIQTLPGVGIKLTAV